MLATLARTIGDLAVAEDALSEATITALDAWPEAGIPDNPRAWLAVVARRKALDLLRRESARAAKETAAFRWGIGQKLVERHAFHRRKRAETWEAVMGYDPDRIEVAFSVSLTGSPIATEDWLILDPVLYTFGD